MIPLDPFSAQIMLVQSKSSKRWINKVILFYQIAAERNLSKAYM